VRHQLVSVPQVAPHLGRTKTASCLRTVPIPGFVATALREHAEQFPAGPFEVIFTNKRGLTVNRQSPHRSFRAALRMAALPSTVAFHQLRHTYATLLIEAGAPALTCAFGCGERKLGLPVPRRLLAAGSA
jgi:integrase